MIWLDNNNKKEVVEATKKAGTASLGNIAKSSTTLGVGSGVHSTDVVDVAKLKNTNRRKRFDLLNTIRLIALQEGFKRAFKQPTEYHRVTLCKHAMHGSAVAVLKSTAHGRAFYDGLQTCGSVWACPVCAEKIQERRRLEVAKVVDWSYANGHQCAMVTFTFPHTKNQKLKTLLDGFSKCLADLRRPRSYELFKKRIGYVGLVRSLEVLHGANGWHPHTHELFVINKDIQEDELKEYLVMRWIKICIKNGLCEDTDEAIKAMLLHSIDVKTQCKASDYLAKAADIKHWGVDRELTKSSKKGKSSGKHPFQLAEENKTNLFIEYLDAIKGKRQIYIVPSLREAVGLEEKSDEELAEEKNDEANKVGLLNKSEWVMVRDREKRAELLEVAESENPEDKIKEYILFLKQNHFY